MFLWSLDPSTDTENFFDLDETLFLRSKKFDLQKKNSSQDNIFFTSTGIELIWEESFFLLKVKLFYDCEILKFYFMFNNDHVTSYVRPEVLGYGPWI